MYKKKKIGGKQKILKFKKFKELQLFFAAQKKKSISFLHL